ncbi:hypothetical protein F4821DRAFT_279015 [Hypoxylon rubiginosum]|uniref:Uncharacterized protein n=1 Tax=Hypoxylon rubiginosum TaxID=110542 RepID=A0ACC0CZ88_9PEZI|nr:hypothetical protein F4821DRAFT_279015 [Hypoxylon rubiginosum]
MVSTRKIKVEDYSVHPLDKFFKKEDNGDEVFLGPSTPEKPSTHHGLIDQPSPNQPSSNRLSHDKSSSSRLSHDKSSSNRLSHDKSSSDEMEPPHIQQPQNPQGGIGDEFSFVRPAPPSVPRAASASGWSMGTPTGQNGHGAAEPKQSMPAGSTFAPLLQSPMPRPGMGQPGMGQPGMGQPGMGQPGMGHPGMGHSDYVYHSLHPMHRQILNMEQVVHAEYLARTGTLNVLFMINRNELIKVIPKDDFRAISYAVIKNVDGVRGWYLVEDGSPLNINSVVHLDMLDEMRTQRIKRGIPFPNVDWNNMWR